MFWINRMLSFDVVSAKVVCLMNVRQHNFPTLTMGYRIRDVRYDAQVHCRRYIFKQFWMLTIKNKKVQSMSLISEKSLPAPYNATR